jgi:hypothetical protein
VDEAGRTALWRQARFATVLVLLLAGGASQADGLIDGLVRRFTESDIEFKRAESDVPFLPAAWLEASGYREAAFVRPDGSSSDINYRQSSLSEGAFLALPIGQRDAFVIGEWLSTTEFRLPDTQRSDFSVLSVSVPIGWIRQASPDWQLAAFVAPLGSTSRDDGWYWETLGGAFARYSQNDRLAWIFGAYFDVAPLEDFYTPYLGATYAFNRHWSLDAVLPWPGVNFAPNKDTFFRLGVAPAGASWSIEPGVRHPRVSLSVWNLGLMASHRLFGQVWLSVEAGISGLRGLSIVGGEFESLQTHMSNTGYASLMLAWRPEVPAPQ